MNENGKLMKTILAILLVSVLYACTDNERVHVIRKLNDGISIDLYIWGEDVGFNDVSYTRDITLKKDDKELKIDLGKSGWPGGYVLFH